MSIEAMRWVFKQSRSIGAARMVLLALADEASDEGEISAYKRSQSHLARKANTDVRTVRRAINRLVEIDELEVVSVGDGYASSNYQILMEVEEGEGGRGARPGRASRPEREGTVPSPSSPSSPSSQDDDSAFNAFWTLCPRKEGKGAAMKAWYALSSEDREAATAAMPLHRDAWAIKFPSGDKTFIPHPSTWLNQRRWEDDVDTTPREKAEPELPYTIRNGVKVVGWSVT